MPRRTGFSLIELLVVVAVLSILAGLLLPVLRRSLAEGERAHCLGNLRQLAISAQVYLDDHGGVYPPAERTLRRNGQMVIEAWDFTYLRIGGRFVVQPGLLWNGETDARVQQCAAFEGKANWVRDAYTGYNYNRSYIGVPEEPAHAIEVSYPAATALFGDGEWSGGANKFMRSPYGSPADTGFSGRYAGTQGYRHLERTNVAFCDGHTTSHADRYATYEGDSSAIAPGTGFLGPDNGLYDLD